MTTFKEIDALELQETQGGFDPFSWALGFFLGQLANGAVEAATGKSVGGWIAVGLDMAKDQYLVQDFRYTQPLYGNW